MPETHVVIMAGGIGSRLWPVSTPDEPKQFIDVLGVGMSLLQLTVERFLPVCNPDNFWVVTSDNYVDIVRKQVPTIPEDQILAEPEPRNTAPCIAYACWKISVNHPDANIVVTPADALVLKTSKFTEVINMALGRTAVSDDIVTIGIKPNRPETGYGYICAESVETDRIVKVSSFREKPDIETAMKYLAAGNYVWNAGIFVWNARTIISQMRMHAPGIAGIMDILSKSFYTEDEKESLSVLFPQCEKISIDYAVMEKSDDIYVISSDLGWSDLGSWTSVGAHVSADDQGNSVVGGDVRLYGCRNCVVNVPVDGTVVLQGLDNYIVSAKNGNILVCQTSQEQHIKEYSQNKK